MKVQQMAVVKKPEDEELDVVVQREEGEGQEDLVANNAKLALRL